MTSYVLVGCHAARLLGGVVSTIYISRKLGAEGLGILSAALAVTGLVSTACEFGMISAHSMAAAGLRRHSTTLLQAGVLIMTTLGILGSVLLFGLAWLLRHSSAYEQIAWYLPAFALPTLLQAGNLFFADLHARGRSAQAALIGTCIGLLGMCVRVSAAANGASVGMLLMLTAGETLAGTLWGWIHHIPKLKNFAGARRLRASGRRLLHWAMKSFLQGQAESLFFKMEILLLAAWSLVAALGDFTAALKLYEICGQLAAYLLVPVIPRLSRLKGERNADERGIFISRALGMLGLLGVSLALGIALAGPTLITLFYGNIFANAAMLAVPFALALPPTILLQFNWRVALVHGGMRGNLKALMLLMVVKVVVVAAGLALGGGAWLAASAFCVSTWVLWFCSAYMNRSCPELAVSQQSGMWGWLFSRDVRLHLKGWIHVSARSGDLFG
jgi:O-antigen/teichoic acid export membrane protein